MARKSKKKIKIDEQPPAADGSASTEEESIRDNGGDDARMDSEDAIPDIVDKDSGDEDAVDVVEEPEEDTEEAEGGDKKPNKKEKKGKKKGNDGKNNPKDKKEAPIMPFMDTFYQLSSEDSLDDRSIAARDLIRHCLLSDGGVNSKDAAYALTRLMNGLCTHRAASRQGFASCLSSFLRAAHSPSLGGDTMERILKEDDYSKGLKGESVEDECDAAHPAMIVRQKLLYTTQFATQVTSKGKKGQKNNRSGVTMKGIEERDHAFGRLFGILAVVRSGILVLEDFPSAVVEGYTNDLIDLYHYKKWMKEIAAHALIELLSSLDTDTNQELVSRVTNDVITPKLFLSPGNSVMKASKKVVDLSDRSQLMQLITPEQIAVALHLQTPRNGEIKKYDYPLDEPWVTAESIATLSSALASTSNVVYPRCHVVWNVLWMYLTEEVKGRGHLRQLGPNEEFRPVIENIIQHVVIDKLLVNTATHERPSLALHIVCTLSGSSELKIALPPSVVSSVLCPDVVTRVFVNVLCASGGPVKKKSKDVGGGGVDHYLKPLTSQALSDFIDCCCDNRDANCRLAFAKAFLLADPRFDMKTKTQTVCSLLMLDSNGSDASEVSESPRTALWQGYLTFLEEKIVSSQKLHDVTVFTDLMYKFAKHDLVAPANEAKRVLRFFMSGAFFDCTELSVPSLAKKKSKKKGNVMAAARPPQELSSGLRIKDILKSNGMATISNPARALLSARFYSLLSDLVAVINFQNRRGSKNKSFHGKGSRPESVYRALSEIYGIWSLLETSGAKHFSAPSPILDAENASAAVDPVETSKKSMLQVLNVANNALVKECDGSGDEDVLRARAVFSTSCASLMISLQLQLNSCGKPEANNDQEEEQDNDVVEAIHEYISDLEECVEGFCQVIEGDSSSKVDDDAENPLAAMVGLLMNILSSPVGGEDSGNTDPIQASASKLIRETVKLVWSGIISVLNGMGAKNELLKNLVDEDVMSTLIESVCGEKLMGDKDDDDDESGEESISSEDDLGDSSVFVNASEGGMDLDEAENGCSVGKSKDSDDESSRDSATDNIGDDVELDPAKLENLLLEDSDAEMSDFGILEHHEGADKALAQLIKMKQEARKASQTERERVDLCNRLRCAGLLDSLFSPSVFKSGWLPVEAVLGSIIPILRSRRAIAKSIQASPSGNAKKFLGEKNSLLERLSSLVKDKISQFRPTGSSSEDIALKAVSDVFDEMKHSLNKDHCSCCSVALITAVRCIPNAEDNDQVKDYYVDSVNDWSSRKATKIHACVFDDLIQRMPSLASLILVEPLIASVNGAHSQFLKCQSTKLLSAIYKNDKVTTEDQLSKRARNTMKDCCVGFAETLIGALSDPSLQKAKHRDEVLATTKHFVSYIKAQDEGILADSELGALQATLKTVGGNCQSPGMKQLCSQLTDTISGLPRREKGTDKEPKPKRSKTPKTPKSSKKQKKSKK